MVIFSGIMRRRAEKAEKRGRARGIAQERAKWQAWNQRRLAAEADGRPFTEPPPSENQPNRQ